jgi:hypothetical protein
VLPPNLLAPAALLSFLALLPGCTLIGLGIGAAVPMHQEVELQQASSLPAGSDVDVLLSPTSSSGDPVRIAGRLQSVNDDSLRLSPARFFRTPRRVPLSRVRELRVVSGSYWLPGLVTGAVIDTVLTALVVHAFQQPWWSSPSNGE